jgi:hypothetical protein
MSTVKEHLAVILANVQGNLKQVENQIEQGRQQIEVATEGRNQMLTLIASIQHLIDIDAADAIEVLKIQNDAAVAQVASSPTAPATAGTPEAAAGSPAG